MTFVALHTIYPAEYEKKPFAGPKLICVQFSLCKMGIIFFFLKALSVLFVCTINSWRQELSFVMRL